MKSRKHLCFVTLTVFVSLLTAFRFVQTDKLEGAWRLAGGDATILITLADNYLIQTIYEPNRYVSTRGGSYRQEGDKLNLLVEFDTQDSGRVGQTETYSTTMRNRQLTLNGPMSNYVFTRVDELPTPLTGLWRITGRANDTGQITPMQRGPRKTIKLLTGSRFQWVAINPQTKQFSGTGGGTYTLKDGKYRETIDLFSRDNNRVGSSLLFNAEVNGNEWHHSGQSSTGGKVNEIWSREK